MSNTRALTEVKPGNDELISPNSVQDGRHGIFDRMMTSPSRPIFPR